MRYLVSLRIKGSVGMVVSASSEAEAMRKAEERLADDIGRHVETGSYDVDAKILVPRKRRRLR